MSRSRPDSPALNPLVVLAGIILILYFARAVLIPLALALTLNFLLTPMVLWFQKLGLRRVPAVALVMLISVSVVAGVGWVVADQLLEVANDLPKYRLHIHNKIEALHFAPDSALGRAADSVSEIGKDFDSSPTPAIPPAGLTAQASPAKTSTQPPAPVPVQVVAPPASGLQYLGQMLGKALVPLGTAGMVLIFTVFILITQVDLRNRVLRLAGVAQLNTMTLALDDASNRVSRYLVVQFLVNASYGVCFGTGLFLIGIPNAILWGIFAGVFRIVPYAGVLTATAFPLVLSLALFDGWGPPVLVILLFALLELVATNLVEPVLYGARTGISALALLVTTVFWTMLWGWAGLVLAVPLTVVGVYDRVLVPALTLAEQDRHKGALDDARESYLFLSISEIVSEFAAYRPEEVAPKSRKLRSRWRSTPQPNLPSSIAEPTPSTVRIFCLAANDQADEITSSMLAQLLERAGHGVLSLPVASPVEEILTNLLPEPQDVVCISAVPPFAFAQARTLCQRIGMHLPQIRIVAGIWGFTGDLDKAKDRFGSTRPDRIVASLAQAVEQISDWHNATLASESAASSALDPTQSR